jgi:hypothetical protein
LHLHANVSLIEDCSVLSACSYDSEVGATRHCLFAAIYVSNSQPASRGYMRLSAGEMVARSSPVWFGATVRTRMTRELHGRVVVVQPPAICGTVTVRGSIGGVVLTVTVVDPIEPVAGASEFSAWRVLPLLVVLCTGADSCCWCRGVTLTRDERDFALCRPELWIGCGRFSFVSHLSG